MKKVLIVAVALASVNAFATRARVTALGNSPHLIDTQTVYSNPSDIMVLADYVNFESGTTAAGAENANAEGMITRSMGDSKFGLSLGHLSQSASTWGLRNATLTGIPAIVSQQNPVGLFYGMKMNDMLIGGNLVYSNYNDKAADIKESSMGLRLGLRTGPWDAKLAIGLGNTYETAAVKYTGTGGISAGVGYAMDDLYFNLAMDQSGFKTENAAGVEQRKFDRTGYSLGVLQSMKKDGSELFWGVALASTTQKLTVLTVDADKTTTMSLPVTLGMEVDAATWLTLRGSVTQNVIISNSKNDITPGGTETAPGLNTTTAAIGTGLKFGKLTVDATLQGLTGGAANQQVNGTNLLALVGATYLY